MSDGTSTSQATATAHDVPPTADSLAKRFFILTMLGVFAYISIIVTLMSGGK
jgi:hypothetical protein